MAVYTDQFGNTIVTRKKKKKDEEDEIAQVKKPAVTDSTQSKADIAPVRQDPLTVANRYGSFTAGLDSQFPNAKGWQSRKGIADYGKKKEEQQEQTEKTKAEWYWEEWVKLAVQSDNPLVAASNDAMQHYREDTSYKEMNDQWTDQQRSLFGYLYQNNPAAAAKYAEAVNNKINRAAADAQKEAIMLRAGDKKIKNTAEAILLGSTALADVVDNLAEFEARGTITQKNNLTPYDMSQAKVEGISKKLNELGKIKENIPVIGGKGFGDLYGLGYSGAQSILYGLTGNGWLTITQFFAQAAASGIDEKMDQGATAQQAILYGLASGAAEAVAEKIGIDKLFKNAGAKTFRGFLGNVLKQGAAEGMEEAVTSVLNTFSDQVIMGKESQYKKAVAEYRKTMDQKNAKRKALWDVFQDIAFDALGGMITGGGNTAVMTGARVAQNVSNAKGALSGLTKNEQKVIDKVYKDLVAEEAKKSKDGKVSQAKKNELYDQAVAAMEKGYIDTDTIEEVLGGDDFKVYQEAQAKEEAVLKELEGLYQGEELAKQQQSIRENTTLPQLRQTMGDKVAELVKRDRLAESYREKDRRSQIFQADLSQYDEKQRTIVQKAIDSGVLNNTNRSHELVDLIAKVGADKALDFDFTNNEKLKESGFALNGKTVNGYISGSGVTVNINSAKALNSVVGHEITHVLEGTGEFYTELESMVTEYAKSKGEYNARLTELRALYADVEGYKGADGHEKIRKELVADLVGDYIFADTDFIRRLSTENRNLFEKIYDEIQYLCRVATAGSKELRQLEKAKKAFEDAYRQDAKNTADDGGVRYSITEPFVDSNGTKFDSAVLLDTNFFDGLSPRNWGGKLRDFVEMRSSTDPFILPVTDENGNMQQLQFATTKDRVAKNGGGDHKVLEELSRSEDNISKLAVIHIDEIVDVSNSDNPYYTSNHDHQWLDQNGWLHRTANVINAKNGNVYNLTFDIAKAKDGRHILYATKGKIKKVGNAQVNSLILRGSRLNSNSNSRITEPASTVKRKDLEYQHAVNRGDTKTAQKMVDEAAKAAGYTIKAYHGTDADAFTVFDKGKIGDASGLSILGDGFYFADKRSTAAQYGKNVYTVYLKQQSPYSATADDAYRLNTAKLNGDGFDSVTLPTGKGTVYMVLDPEQIKSADPITYDDDGNVIPLSERFNQEKEDIRYSVSSKEDIGPVRKDLEAVRGNIYGKDVALDLGPVREDLNTAGDQTEDPYEDLPFDMPEELAGGELTDEELDADIQRNPITTVAERLDAKLTNLRREMKTNEANRKAAWDAYEQKITELRERYDGKKHKQSKASNAILRQIARQEGMQKSVDAEYEKRIHDIQKKIQKTQEQMRYDHTSEDLLEKQLRQVDEQLEQDKQSLTEEIEKRRAELENSLADKGAFISREARSLYKEIRDHEKGTKFSAEIGELLDAGYSWSQIKNALLLVEGHPQSKGSSWVVEQKVRQMLDEKYENRSYELDGLDTELQNRMTALETEAEETRKSYTTAAQRKNKQAQYEQQMEALVGDTSAWKDKKLGIQYQINTLRRNLRDVVRDEKGNRDIAKADAIWDELQGKYNHNEAELKRESARIKEKYAAMKITKAEDVYIQMLGEFRHNPETELSLETVEGFYEEHKDQIDTEKVDKVIEMSRKDYDELLQRVNAVLREQGMKEIPYRQGYFPHFTEEAKGRFRMFLEKVLNFKYRGDDIPTDIAGLTEGFTPNRSWQRFNKQRTSDLTAYSFTKGMDSYAHGALDWIYHIEDIQKRRALENHIRYIHSDEGIQARIEAAKNNDLWDADQVQEEIDKILKEAKNPLNNLVTDLRTGTNILAGKKNTMDRGMENATNRKVYSVMTSLSSRVNANMVAGSISSALTNFIPITQSWGEVSPKSSLRAMAETIMSYVTDDGAVDKSDFLTNRLRPEENLHKTGWDKINDKVGWLMEAVDDFTSQTVWRSKYQENLSNGMSEAEAIKNADEFAESVMAGRSRGNMPTIFDAKNPFARILTAFQLEVNNQYGYMFKDLPINLQKEAKKNLVGAYSKMFLGAYAYNALYSQLTGRNAAFDPLRIIQELLEDMFPDDDEEEKKPSEIVGNLVNNVAEELPFIGGLMGGGRIPISSALPYGEGPIEMITGTMQDIENRDIANLTWEWMNPVFYLVAPVGGGQARKTAQGLSMFFGDKPVSGSYTSSGNLRFPVAETPLNIAQAAVFGQWANENARTYIEEGRSPIPESQIQEFLDSGLTYDGWWAQKDTLKKVAADFDASEPIQAFNAAKDQLEALAADDLAGDKEILQEKFIQSAAAELSKIKKEMTELSIAPVAQNYRDKHMQALKNRANEIAEAALEAYSTVKIDGIYANVGEKVWMRGNDGEWKQLTGEQLSKYQATIASGAEIYAVDGRNHYVETKDGWKKLTDDQLAKQNAVTKALGIKPKEYWGEKNEEYDFAYENPDMYLVAKAVGGYDAYSSRKTVLNKIKADTKDGKAVSGSRKEKVWAYISQQDMEEGQKYLLFKSVYPADDTYNREIIKYLNSRRDMTFEEKKRILEKLDFKVNKNGTIEW